MQTNAMINMLRLKKGAPKLYDCVTTSKVVVEQQAFENTIHTTFKTNLLDQSETSNLIRVEILSFQQTAQDPMSALIADMNQLSQHLVFECDLNGNALKIVNYTDLISLWYPLKEDIRYKYGRTTALDQLLAAFEKNLSMGSAALLEAMQHKGIYGLLFSGIYAFRAGAVFEVKREIKNLFGTIDLPLKVHCQTTTLWQEVEAIFKIQGQGVLDDEVFAKDAFRQLIRQIHDSFNLKVDLKVHFTEFYDLRQSDCWVKKAEQCLKAEVAGVYFNETKHSLTLKNEAQ